MAKNKQRKVNHWGNLVVAMLSLNQYPLEKTLNIYDRLESNGLFDPHKIKEWSYDKLYNRLIDSGYDRGRMTDYFAERLWSLGLLVDDFTANDNILAAGSDIEVALLLTKIRGVGPVVLKNYKRLSEKC